MLSIIYNIYYILEFKLLPYLKNDLFDIVVVGGGINGVGIARDAAGRGLKVLLCEKGDLASATSSASTKLIHGGLRYLENYEFRLVRESLKESNILYNSAPHIISPLKFILPHNNNIRPYWMIRCGLFLYDHMGKRKNIPKSTSVNLNKNLLGEPLNNFSDKGVIYSDYCAQDARLVVLSAVDANNKGAVILTRAEAKAAKVVDGNWQISMSHDGSEKVVNAKLLVNATGPWVNNFIKKSLGREPRQSLKLVKGSHIIVPKIFTHDHAYILQIDDGRIIFAIPYENDFTLIGTTEVDFSGDPKNANISDAEILYLTGSINKFFKKMIFPKDIRWSYSGVRPLFGDGNNLTKISRDYFLELDETDAPLLNIYGGKLTTFRKLSENAVNKISKFFPDIAKPWTEESILPGGDFEKGDFNAYLSSLRKKHPWMTETLSYRLARNYGTLSEKIIGHAKNVNDLGVDFGAELYQSEVDYLRNYEFAVDIEDILWRRTKLGLVKNFPSL